MAPAFVPAEPTSAPAVEVGDDDDQQHTAPFKRTRVDLGTQTDPQPLALSVDLPLTPADQVGIDAAWLCEYGSPQMASFVSFLIEAMTNSQRGFPRIAAHCLARLKIASGNDKSSAPDAHSAVSLIKNVVLTKSILTAKTTNAFLTKHRRESE